MTEFERLVDRDVDDLLDYARRLTGRARTAAVGDALSRLEQTKDAGTRVRILRFLQTLLADVPNGRLPASAAEPAAFDLSRIVTSSDEHIEARRAALDTLALLFLKAKELTPLADSRVRAAFQAASSARDAQLNRFARTSLSPSGVLCGGADGRRAPTRAPPSPPHSWNAKNILPHMRPFVSYAREDLAWARRICADLREKGIRPWFDKDDLVAGRDWRAQIRKAVEESSHFIMLLSSHSVSKTGFVQSEIHHALTLLDERPANRIFVIPVRLDDCHPDDERIDKLHRIDLFTDYDAGITHLIKSLRAAARRPKPNVRKSATESPRGRKAAEELVNPTRRVAPRPEKDRSRTMVHYYRGPGEASERITLEDRDAQVDARISKRTLREFMRTDAVVKSLEQEIAIATGREQVDPADTAIAIADAALAWTSLNTVGALHDELQANQSAVISCATELLANETLPISGCASLVALACVDFARQGEESCLRKTLENAGIREREARETTLRKILSTYATRAAR